MDIKKEVTFADITIKPLTPDISYDYFDFFENRAFPGNSPYRCYCQMYHMMRKALG